jgi:hypothetical protein
MVRPWLDSTRRGLSIDASCADTTTQLTSSLYSYLLIFIITKIHIFKLSIQNKLKGSKFNKQWTAPKTPPVPHILIAICPFSASPKSTYSNSVYRTNSKDQNPTNNGQHPKHHQSHTSSTGRSSPGWKPWPATPSDARCIRFKWELLAKGPLWSSRPVGLLRVSPHGRHPVSLPTAQPATN